MGLSEIWKDITDTTNGIDGTEISADIINLLAKYVIENEKQISEIDPTSPVNLPIVDNLYTTDPNQALSANMGAYLEYSKLNKTDIIDNLNSLDIDKPLSAYQGFVLANSKLSIYDVIDDLYTYDSYKPLSANAGAQLNDTLSQLYLNLPTNLSHLYNDAGYVQDYYYVHTDNNFTDKDKEKLDNIGEETDDNSTIIVLDNNSPEIDKIYSKSITGSIDFVLPTVTDGKFHQILILATIENTPAITYGTDYYFNGVVPTVDNGECDIIFEFDGVKWTAGVISKGSEK